MPLSLMFATNALQTPERRRAESRMGIFVKTKSNVLTVLITILATLGLFAYFDGGDFLYANNINLCDFGFTDIYDFKDADVLNYQLTLGGDLKFGPNRYATRSGDVLTSGQELFLHRKPTSLYVKWRQPSTGKIYEREVNLASRLPIFVGQSEITFIIHGPNLFVYLAKTGKWFPHPIASSDHVLYSNYEYILLYPTQQSN